MIDTNLLQKTQEKHLWSI